MCEGYKHPVTASRVYAVLTMMDTEQTCGLAPSESTTLAPPGPPKLHKFPLYQLLERVAEIKWSITQARRD